MRKKSNKTSKLRKLKCYVCKKTFYNYISQAEINYPIRRVCSKECKAKLVSQDKRKGEFRVCERCGKEFWVRPSEDRGKHKKKYCNMKCQLSKCGGNALSIDGYYVKNGIKIHRIIMEKYLGRELSSNEIVHHINSNKLDNRIENLVVITRGKHNKIHFSGEKSHNSKLTNRQVSKIKELLKKNVSIKNLSELYSVSISTIYQIRAGYTWKHIQ